MSTVPPDPQGQPAYTPPPAAAPASPPPAAAPSGSGYPVQSDPGYAPPAPAAGAKPKGPKTLGLIAFVVALLAVVVGSVLTYLGGLQVGPLAQYADTTTGTVDTTDIPADAQQAALAGGALIVAGFVAMAVLALWGFIQGIIAAVKNRGRGWGIAAIIIAVLSVIPVSIFLGVGTAAGLAPYLTGS